MTKGSIQLTLEGGYLMQAFDNYLTPGRDGFFADYGRRAFATNDAGDINPELHTSFLPTVTALAVEKGIPANVVEQLKQEAALRTRQLLSIPGGLEKLHAAMVEAKLHATARRRARDN